MSGREVGKLVQAGFGLQAYGARLLDGWFLLQYGFTVSRPFRRARVRRCNRDRDFYIAGAAKVGPRGLPKWQPCRPDRFRIPRRHGVVMRCLGTVNEWVVRSVLLSCVPDIVGLKPLAMPLRPEAVELYTG